MRIEGTAGEGHKGGENRSPKKDGELWDIGAIPLGRCEGVFPPWDVLQFGVHQLPHLSLGFLVL